MNRHDGFAPTSEERRRSFRQTAQKSVGFAVGVIGLMLFAAFAVVFAAPVGPMSTPAAAGSAHPVTFASGTHGDLVVTAANSPFIIAGVGAANATTYYQQGNITVQSGGVLEVVNTTLSFVQFITTNGSTTNPFSNLYSFQDQGGTIRFSNAILTTDLGILNPFPKLNFTIGPGSQVWANSSAFEFPGSIFVNGTGSQITFYNSTIEPNPTALATLGGAPQIYNESSYSPNLFAANGAHFTLLKSAYDHYYANAISAQNSPAAGPFVNATTQSLPADSVAAWTLAVPPDSHQGAEQLTEAAFYPTISSGTVFVSYNASAAQNVPADFNYTTSVAFANPIAFSDGVGLATAALPASAISEINSKGIPAFVAAVAAGTVTFYLDKSGSAAATLNVTGVTLVLTPQVPAYPYDMVAAGAGTTITLADSFVGLNWSAAPATNYTSHKLRLFDGATAFLASVSIPPYNLTGYNAYGSTSYVVPDSQSTAYIYRWLDIPVLGEGNQAVTGASAAVYYAYDSSQGNNATTTRMNDLPTVDAALSTYVVDRANLMGAPAYGTSNGTGHLQLLLLDAVVTASSLPNGNFTGTYHVAVSVPGGADPAQWMYASLTAYTAGSGYTTGPDAGAAVTFPTYTPAPPIQISYNPPTGTVNVGSSYSSSGTLTFSGPAVASVTVLAVGPGTEFQQYVVGTATSPSGAFALTVTPPQGMPAGTYSLTVEATENGVSSQITMQNALTVSTGGPTSFLNEKFFGLELWMWLAIAAAIVAAVVVVLLMFQRSARGKLVECGECGELIPESATQCPKCGAEFESALVRCSRCGSTIPANSKVCPECAAQLLGDPAQEQSDPERQGYADFVERYRAAGKKELGENFTEGAFWDWWKRQPSYLPFSQWRLQQAQTSRAGMTAPPTEPTGEPEATAPAYPSAPQPPPARRAAAPAAAVAAPVAAAQASRMTQPAAQRPPAYTAPPTTTYAAPPTAAPPAAAQAAQTGLRACSNCSKEIPSDYLVCPFCGAVTR